MSNAADGWMEQAKYDIDTARAMLDSGRFLYVLFCCQQSLEKALKALIVQRTGTFPPRIHNLTQLAESVEPDILAARKEFLRELTAYYIQSRYPEELMKAGAEIDRETAQNTLLQTEKELQWLQSLLK